MADGTEISSSASLGEPFRDKSESRLRWQSDRRRDDGSLHERKRLRTGRRLRRRAASTIISCVIESILPGSVVAEESHDVEAPPLHPDEVAALGHASDTRRREFALARGCARRAVVRLGFAPGPILPGPRREPLWPDGVVGSITHCRGYAAAAVARARDLGGLGIDAEPHERVPDGVLRAFAHPAELAALRALGDTLAWGRILFSAKESAYKALSAHGGAALRPEGIVVSIDAASSRFRAAIAACPRRACDVEGAYAVVGGFVLAAAAVTAPDAPYAAASTIASTSSYVSAQ